MKFSKLMVAVAALAAGSAFAAPLASQILLTSGASAPKNNIKLALTAMCTTAGGSLTEFTSGSNISTYVCSTTAGLTQAQYNNAATVYKNFAGTTIAEVRLNVAGGSFTAIQTLAGGADSYLNPGTGTTTSTTGSSGGFHDVNYDAFPETVKNAAGALPGTVTKDVDVGVAQGFGVAVSGALYTAMFNKQLGAEVKTGCLVTDTNKPECVPSISKGDMVAIINANEFSAPKLSGAEFLGGAALAGQELRYVRRVDTSGTQAAAQTYFLALPCSSAAQAIINDPNDTLNAVPPATSGPAATDDEAGGLKDALYNGIFRVLAAPGTGDVRNELNKTDLDTVTPGVQPNYAIGVMSLENNQSAQTWKWIRVQEAFGGENATPASAGITNDSGMKNGRYDFYEELKASYKNAAAPFWTALIAKMQTLAAPIGLVTLDGTTMPYSRAGNACSPSFHN